MAICTTSTNNPGKKVAVEFAIGFVDAVFLSLTYLPLGTINAKELAYAATTTDNTNDQSGAVTSEIVVRSGMEITVSGFITSVDSAKSAQDELVNYYWTELQANRQPSVWLRISGPDYPRTWHIFTNYKGGTESFNTDDAQGITFDFGVTDTGATNLSVNIS